MSLTTQKKLSFAAAMSLLHMAGTPLMRTMLAHGHADSDNMRNMFYMQLTGCLLTLPAYYLCASLASYAALDDSNAQNRTCLPQTRIFQLIVLISVISTGAQANTGKAILDLLAQLLDVKILAPYKHGGFQSENNAIFDTNLAGIIGDLVITLAALVLDAMRGQCDDRTVVYRQLTAEAVVPPVPPNSPATVVSSVQMIGRDRSETSSTNSNLSLGSIAIPDEENNLTNQRKGSGV